jgi:hypothetical protein
MTMTDGVSFDLNTPRAEAAAIKILQLQVLGE